MGLQLPLTLSGSNLKDRHHHLNSLVNETFTKNVPFQYIVNQPETSAVDRIFKIDLASKYRNVEYILINLKDDDMLYVSRALKCLWLLEPHYSHIINPLYLENTLYPEMIQPAVNKMKHWIQLNLKNLERCQEFYNHYKANFDHGFNYFWHCSNEFVMSEFPHVIDKLTQKQLKILFEVCPSVCKLYFDILPNNKTALTKYVNNAFKYFTCITSILKYDGNIFLDIVEKYFDNNSFNPFGPSTTHYIMKYYRSRFDAKCELYTSSFLHIKTLAANLTSDQAKELILRLARAEYLDYWFTYKNVEPLVKRLKPESRSSLKRQIFVEKDIGCKVKEWPYPIPKPIMLEIEDKTHIFTDIKHEPYEYENCYYDYGMLRKRKLMCGYRAQCEMICVGKSPLDQMFNRYRFNGFEQTFYELSKNLQAESSQQGRLNMMLVLVSKSGGVTEQVHKFLKLMVERHINEPNTVRAAVIRSLVKRGCVWRLTEDVWSLLMEFGKDIGLDGAETDSVCREGLHAVVLRHLMTDKTFSPSLLTGYRREFSTLAEYKLNADEIKVVAMRLPPLILTLDPHFFLDTLVQYKVDIKSVANAESALLKATKGDSALVARLYKARILRREIFRESFALKQNNAAYINSLRYDTSLLNNGNSFAKLVVRNRPNHDRFLKSLNTYFAEPGGLAELHRISLEEAFETIPKIWFPRSLCFLLSKEQLLDRIFQFESDRPQSKGQLLMSTGLRANAHKTKPPLDIVELDWRWVGAKAVANKVFISKSNVRQRYIKKLLEWRRTARISVRLSFGTPSSTDTFIDFCSRRPTAALKVALSLYLNKDHIESFTWEAIKSLVVNTDVSQKRLLRKLSDPKSIPEGLSGDYWMLVYNILFQLDKKKAKPILCRLENILEDVDQNFIDGVVKEFIDNQLTPNTFATDHDDFYSTNIQCLYVRMIAKHLLLCKTVNEQNLVIKNLSEPFFDALEILIQTSELKEKLIELLNDFILSLKFSKVFLSEHYVSCMPVFESILKRMQKIFPVEEYFDKYIDIHLTMLYYKTLRQIIQLKPGICDNYKQLNEATEIVGRLFGKYIGHEIKELVTKYFKSVVDLYKVSLNKYLRDYFNFSDSRHLLAIYVVKGLLEVDTTEAFILAEYIFQSVQEYQVCEPHRAEILKVLKESKDEEVKLFLYTEVTSVQCI